jgi:hypothetical protein
MPLDRPTDTTFSPTSEDRPASRRVLGFRIALLGLAALALPVLARSPEDALGGSVRLYTRSIPRFTSDRQATSFYRSASVEQIGRAADGSWQAEVVAFLDEPLGDFEATLIFFDVSDGDRRFVRSTTAMVHDKDTRVVRKRITLAEPEFHPRRWYEVVVTRRRAEITRAARFFTDGVVDTTPQVVEFTESEAREESPFADL